MNPCVVYIEAEASLATPQNVLGWVQRDHDDDHAQGQEHKAAEEPHAIRSNHRCWDLGHE